MSRRIITTKLQSSGGEEYDGYFDRLLKYIPADVVGAWLVCKNFVRAYTETPALTLWFCLTGGCVVTLLILRCALKKPATWTQVVVSIGAFVVWTWALGEPLSEVVPHSELFSSLVLVGYTVTVATIVPNELT